MKKRKLIIFYLIRALIFFGEGKMLKETKIIDTFIPKLSLLKWDEEKSEAILKKILILKTHSSPYLSRKLHAAHTWIDEKEWTNM